MSEWGIEIGQIVTRADVAAGYGGSTQGGIQPSKRTPNVLIYSDANEGAAYGYSYDGWEDLARRAFYYTGEGQVGDQQLVRGNQAILSHRTDGRALRLFEAVREPVRAGGRRHRYLGEFECDPASPCRREDALDRLGEERTVLVFRLLAVERTGVDSVSVTDAEPVADPVVELVDAERNQVISFAVAATTERTASRREAELMAELERALKRQGHSVRRAAIIPPGHTQRLLTDTFDETTGVLYEVKSNATRRAVREAIAQLLDYRRFLRPTECAVVLPVRPADDLADLITLCGFALVVPERGEFSTAHRSTLDPPAAIA